MRLRGGGSLEEDIGMAHLRWGWIGEGGEATVGGLLQC